MIKNVAFYFVLFTILVTFFSPSESFLREIKHEWDSIVRLEEPPYQYFATKSSPVLETDKTTSSAKRKEFLSRLLGNRKRRSLHKSQDNGFSKDIMRMIEDNFPCRNPKNFSLITSGTRYFDYEDCSQCYCHMGQLNCKKNLTKCYPNACHLQNGEIVKNLAIHNDGCNSCLCYFGQLVCTRLRCPEAGHRYTNYKSLGLDNAEPEKSLLSESVLPARKPDDCLECDHLTGSSVCGLRQWKTFPTLCHAMFCGKNKETEIEDRACELLNPCSPSPCRGNKQCVPFYQAPCIGNANASVTCRQFKCVSSNTECLKKDMFGPVCGKNGQSYKNQCEMLKTGVNLAYKGICRNSCKSEVCGLGSITYVSRCHANDMKAHVDYDGRCEYYYKSAIMKDYGKNSVFEDENCDMVYENKRCPPVNCESTVSPPGSCCPVCGSALVISVNQKTSDKKQYRIEHIYKFLTEHKTKHLVDLCKISVDLTHTMDILVVIQPFQEHDLGTCKEFASEITDLINFDRKRKESGILATLGAAILIKEKAVERMDISDIVNLV